MMKQLAVFAGTFDPVTTGHEHVVRRAADLFGSVAVLVCRNAEKRTLFTAEERVALCKAAFSADARVTVELCESTVSDAALRLGASCIVRGVRDSVDFAYEARFAAAMRALGAPEVVFFDVCKEYSDVSSTFVRELLHYQKPYDEYVPALSRALLAEYASKKA